MELILDNLNLEKFDEELTVLQLLGIDFVEGHHGIYHTLVAGITLFVNPSHIFPGSSQLLNQCLLFLLSLAGLHGCVCRSQKFVPLKIGYCLFLKLHTVVKSIQYGSEALVTLTYPIYQLIIKLKTEFKLGILLLGSIGFPFIELMLANAKFLIRKHFH